MPLIVSLGQKKQEQSARHGILDALHKQWQSTSGFDSLSQPQICEDFKLFSELAEKFLRSYPEDIKSRIENQQNVCGTDMYVWPCLFFALRGGFNKIALGIAEFLKNSSEYENLATWVESVVNNEQPKCVRVAKPGLHCSDPFKLVLLQLSLGMDCKSINLPHDRFWVKLVSKCDQDGSGEMYDGFLPFLKLLYSTSFVEAIKYLWDNNLGVEAVHFALVLHAIGELTFTREKNGIIGRDIFVQTTTENGKHVIEMNVAAMLLKYVQQCLLKGTDESALFLCLQYARLFLEHNSEIQKNFCHNDFGYCVVPENYFSRVLF